MSGHLQFVTADGILVAIEGEPANEPDTDESGVDKAGLRDRAGAAVQMTQDTFEKGVRQLLDYNAGLFSRAMRDMADPPAEAELSFGLKLSGELGGLVITKMAGEAVFGVRLLWRDPAGQ